MACPLRSTIVNPAALPLPTVAPYARPLPGQSDGVDDFVSHGNIGVAEKENS